MRSTSDADSGTWATLVRTHRQAARLDQVAFARRVGVDRGTVRRWEQGTYLPRRPEVVHRVAALFGIDTDTALRAAGLLLAAEAPKITPVDPDVLELARILADPATPEATREQIRTVIRGLRELAQSMHRHAS